MPKKNHVLVIILLVIVAFFAGGVLSPDKVLSDSYGTCSGGGWTIHKPGYHGVRVDPGLKITKVERTSDHIVWITVEDR